MTDEHLDRMVRDADPYRRDVVRSLDGAAQDLLEEIMSIPTLEPVAGPPQTRPRARRGILRGVAGGSVAAALLAGVLVVSAIQADQPERRADPPVTSEATNPAGYSAVVLRAAEQNPRLLIDRPGWKVTNVSGFAEATGGVVFSDGALHLKTSWHPANLYDRHRDELVRDHELEKVKVGDWPAELYGYDASDFAVILRPRDGSFVTMRTAGAWTRGELDRVLADFVRVDARTWLAALPPEVVTPLRVEEEAAKILADVPLPPGFDIATLDGIGVNDAYSFGARVTGRVGCAWIAEWERAKRAGDDAALQRAADALRGSHEWKVLRQMNDKGHWPEIFWGIADQVAAGQPPTHYEESLGC